MSGLHTWHYGAVKASVEFRNEICIVGLVGPVTRRSLDQLKVDVLRSCPRPTRVFVVDVSTCAIAVTADELGELALDAHMHGVIKEPVVFVVNEEQGELFGEHSEAMIEHGLLRIRARSMQLALGWALRRVAVAAWSVELQRSGRRTVRVRAGI